MSSPRSHAQGQRDFLDRTREHADDFLAGGPAAPADDVFDETLTALATGLGRTVPPKPSTFAGRMEWSHRRGREATEAAAELADEAKRAKPGKPATAAPEPGPTRNGGYWDDDLHRDWVKFLDRQLRDGWIDREQYEAELAESLEQAGGGVSESRGAWNPATQSYDPDYTPDL